MPDKLTADQLEALPADGLYAALEQLAAEYDAPELLAGDCAIRVARVRQLEDDALTRAAFAKTRQQTARPRRAEPEPDPTPAPDDDKGES